MGNVSTKLNMVRFQNSSLIFLTLYGLWKIETSISKPKPNAGVLSFGTFNLFSAQAFGMAWTKKSWTEASYYLQEHGLVNISQISLEDGTPTIVISSLGCAAPANSFETTLKWTLKILGGKNNWLFKLEPSYKSGLDRLYAGKSNIRKL